MQKNCLAGENLASIIILEEAADIVCGNVYCFELVQNRVLTYDTSLKHLPEWKFKLTTIYQICFMHNSEHKFDTSYNLSCVTPSLMEHSNEQRNKGEK